MAKWILVIISLFFITGCETLTEMAKNVDIEQLKNIDPEALKKGDTSSLGDMLPGSLQEKIPAAKSKKPDKSINAFKSNCKGRDIWDNVDISMTYGGINGCFVNVKHSVDYYISNNERIRDYQLFQNGLIHIYASTSDKPKLSQSIGVRSFHLLPFNPTHSSYAKPDGSGMVDFIAPMGLRASVSKDSGKIVSLEGYTIRIGNMQHIDQMVAKKGDVTIKPKPGHVLVDYGFRLGEIPVSQMWRTVTVTDGYGNRCSTKITNFFKPRPGDAYEADFKFSSTSQVKNMLSSRCPQIRW